MIGESRPNGDTTGDVLFTDAYLSELVTPIHGVRSPDESQTHLLPSILSIITLTTLIPPAPLGGGGGEGGRPSRGEKAGLLISPARFAASHTGSHRRPGWLHRDKNTLQLVYFQHLVEVNQLLLPWNHPGRLRLPLCDYSTTSRLPFLSSQAD